MEIFLSEYIYMVILRCVVHKLYAAENCLPGLSLANLRNHYFPQIFCFGLAVI